VFVSPDGDDYGANRRAVRPAGGMKCLFRLTAMLGAPIAGLFARQA